MFVSKSVMIVGSSMTQRAYNMEHLGFGIGLSDWYSRVADIFLRGQSGYNSRWTLASLPELIGPHKPDMAIIFLGNNDSITQSNGQSVPVEEFRLNMLSIMKKFRCANPQVVFLLLTPTKATRSRVNSITEKYTRVVREIGELDDRAAVVELWDGNNAISSSDLCDGLHLNVEGNQKVLNGIKATTRLYFPELVPFNDLDPLIDEKENLPNFLSPSQIDGNSQMKTASDKKCLKWLFPPWNQLSGKSVGECTRIMNLARLRSHL